VCQQAKPKRVKYTGLLPPISISDNAWHTVSMDFVKRLPLSGNADSVLIVVDKFTRYAHFLPLKHPYTTETVARVFLDNIYKLHGMPQAIISGRDKIFTSSFWRELFSLTQVQLCMSTTYHPQFNGQTEKVNRCMKTYLRCFVNACHKKWMKWLSLAEFWYNTSFHSAMGRSPFEAPYRHSPRYLGIPSVPNSSAIDIDQWIQER
jgi:transposase InsO family protein